MRRPITAPLVALVALGGLVAPVQGGSISGTYSGVATLTPTTPGFFVQNFTGHGDDTTFGSFVVKSSATVDFSKQPDITLSDGKFSEIFSQGTLFGICSGSGTASGHGTATFTVDYIFTGGTGLFAGDTGEATITATVTSTGSTTESATGSYAGSLVPEPSSLALLASAVAVGAVVVVRGRRREVMAR
jgi:hypothetical protein